MKNRPALLPDFVTAADLALHFGMTERTMRDKLRELGCYAVVGRKWVLFPEHVEELKEALKCRSNSTSGENSGTTGEQLPDGNYEALLARRKEQSQSGSRRKPKPKRGEVISMDQRRT